MPDPIKRREVTHIDEVTRTATSTVQWLLENRNLKGQATHPITHNNKLEMFIGGEHSFANIYADILAARESIDICCWGFDPGMELVRGAGASWPRGITYGDALIDAARRGVRVRLLVWYSSVAASNWLTNQYNMPGYTHATSPWFLAEDSKQADQIGAQHSIGMLQKYSRTPTPERRMLSIPQGCSIREELFPIQEAQIPSMARAEYCRNWYWAAFNGLLAGIRVRTRNGSVADIARSLASEKIQPSGLGDLQAEGGGMKYGGAHHQKPILIDFAFEEGRKAVGYVMGLNSLTDYWDTCEHKLEDHRRECGGIREAEEAGRLRKGIADFKTFKPYHDYACRIQGGRALIELHNNFVGAWDRAADDRTYAAGKACTGQTVCADPPAQLLRPAVPGDSTVQIVRTQPEEDDKTIKEAYFQATDTATLAARYLYVENQYLQYEEWAQRLLEKRTAVIQKWRDAYGVAKKSLKDMPIMYVFIVIPMPERPQMIPRTYDTLATLGQQDGLTGQSALIKSENDKARLQGDMAKQRFVGDELGNRVNMMPSVPDVVRHANQIDKPSAAILEGQFGLRICTAMSNTCDFDGEQWRYREVYIHSKLMLADDVFMTIGSANLNQRSMAVDSEINLSTIDSSLVRGLRQKIWSLHSGNQIDGGEGKRSDIALAFKNWSKLMSANKEKKFNKKQDVESKNMIGFLLPFEDRRSSLKRLG